MKTPEFNPSKKSERADAQNEDVDSILKNHPKIFQTAYDVFGLDFSLKVDRPAGYEDSWMFGDDLEDARSGDVRNHHEEKVKNLYSEYRATASVEAGSEEDLASFAKFIKETKQTF